MCKKLGYLISLVLMLTLAGSALAAIEFDAVSTGVDGGGDDTLSWSHTIGSGSNRILIVAPANEDGNEEDMAITSIKYNNVSMTAVSGGSSYEDPVKAYLYYMLEEDLPSAGTYTVEIIYADTVSDLIGGAVSLSGVAQQAPEAVATNSDEDENVISTNITTQTDGAWVVDVVCHSRGENFITTTAGMTERYDEDSGAHTAAGATKAVASAGSTTMSWEFDGSDDPIVHVLAAFAPSGATSPPGKATNPSPSHQATGVSITADLSWTAGSGATSHDVYFGTDSTPDAGEFEGNQGGTTYDPGTLSYNTTYYWRIDEKNAGGTTTGDVWSFTTEQEPQNPPGKATNPSPSHQATSVSINADLSWTAGSGATSHDVYFGTDSTPDAGEFKGNQGGTTYDPGTLGYETTYYWRIDEENAYGTTTGDVWSFTTEVESGGGGQAPVADFFVVPTSGWDDYYKPEFVSTSTGDITSYEWDFGDNSTSSEMAANHKYSSSGTYTVTLTVSGPGGSDEMVKTSHITVNDFSSGYSYDDYVLTSATQTAFEDALDDIETAGGGRMLFDSSIADSTINLNWSATWDFFGDNLIIDGQDKNIRFVYTGSGPCDQTEGGHSLRIHGDDNIVRNITWDRFPDGLHIRDGYRNLIENCTVNTICEDAMTMNGGGYECEDCIIRDCTYGSSVDKAVMVNNGGKGVFRGLDFTNSRQPIRFTGSTGYYVVRVCDFDGTLNTSTGPRCSGGHTIYFEDNYVHNSQYGIRVYNSVEAIIRNNTFTTGEDYGVLVYDTAKVRLEKNTVTNYDADGVSIDESALADLGGGSVSIDGSSAASAGGNTFTGSGSYDVQNNTGSAIKAEYNYWDHSTVSDVEQYDVDGSVDVDPLGS